MILCGTDFTPRAAEAAEVAAALAARTREPLLVVHVLAEQGDAQPAIEQLRAEAERLRTLSPELQVETKLEAGIPDEVITGMAQLSTANEAQGKQNARLVVVSSLGRRIPSRWLLGSVAERTAQTSSAPTLLVRDAKPFLSWLRGDRHLRIVVGFDFSETSPAALRWASALGHVGACEVVVGHITWPTEERARLHLSRAVGAFKNFAELEVLLRSDIGGRIRDYGWKDEPPTIRIGVNSGRRGNALAELATQERADLLIVGSRQVHGPSRLWQESVSRGALYHAAMSVACVPTMGCTGAGELARPMRKPRS